MGNSIDGLIRTRYIGNFETDSGALTVTGKVQKFRMREASVVELGLQAAAAIKTA